VLANPGLMSWPLLAILGFLGACGTVAYGVVAPTLVPALVPMRLLAANGRIELARAVGTAGDCCRPVGPVANVIVPPGPCGGSTALFVFPGRRKHTAGVGPGLREG
jgi:hypothetical protein